MLSDQTNIDIEVEAKPSRRHRTIAEKSRFLADHDTASGMEQANMRRREGVSSSSLLTWRKQLSSSKAEIAAPGQAEDAQPAESAALKKRCDMLTQRLLKAQEVLDAQEKVCAIWRTCAIERVDQDMPQEWPF